MFAALKAELYLNNANTAYNLLNMALKGRIEQVS